MDERSTVATPLLSEERPKWRYFWKEGSVRRTLKWKENVDWVQDGVTLGNLSKKSRVE